jgi:hypothetical protein
MGWVACTGAWNWNWMHVWDWIGVEGSAALLPIPLLSFGIGWNGTGWDQRSNNGVVGRRQVERGERGGVRRGVRAVLFIYWY